MCAPSYDPQTLAMYFQPLHSNTLNDPEIAPVLVQIAETYPDIIAAVQDVDRSQIRSSLERNPIERLMTAFAMAETFVELRHAIR